MAKANIVIQKNEDGFDVNYGTLVLVELAGVYVTLEDWRAEQLGLTYTVVDKVPEFVKGIKLSLDYHGNHQIYVHVFHKGDIKQVGWALSLIKDGFRVSVYCSARTLMAWENGVVVSEQRPLSDFYSGLTPAEIEASSF